LSWCGGDGEILAESAWKKTAAKWVSLRNVIVIFCSVMERICEMNDHNASPLDFFIAFSVLATPHSKRFVTAFNGVREGKREFDFRVLQGFVGK